MKHEFKALIFDLDDTIYNTTQNLTHPAFSESFKVMIQLGLQTDIETCFFERKNTLIQYSRDTFFEYLMDKYSVKGSEEDCLKSGIDTFQNTALQTQMSMETEDLKTLRLLSSKYPLFLVTSGNRKTQLHKINQLRISPYFKSMFFVDPRKRKRDSFFKILKTLEQPPQNVLSIGNRLDMEISDSKALGLKTCHMLRGEYSHIVPNTSFEVPDYTILKISEITNICQI